MERPCGCGKTSPLASRLSNGGYPEKHNRQVAVKGRRRLPAARDLPIS